MGSERVDLSKEDFDRLLGRDLNKRLEDYITKRYRAYITAHGLKGDIVRKALREWLDKQEG